MNKLQAQLKDRYTNDYIAAWRTYFFKNSAVLPYANMKDAADKLNKQSGIQSPILELFWLASQNLDVDSPKVRDVFQSVLFITPAAPDRFIAGSNQPYLNSLMALQTAIAAISGPTDSAGAASSKAQATSATNTVKQAAQNFRLDQEGHMEARTMDLLLKPITYAEGTLPKPGAEVNAGGPGFCAGFNLYPFNPAASRE